MRFPKFNSLPILTGWYTHREIPLPTPLQRTAIPEDVQELMALVSKTSCRYANRAAGQRYCKHDVCIAYWICVHGWGRVNEQLDAFNAAVAMDGLIRIEESTRD